MSRSTVTIGIITAAMVAGPAFAEKTESAQQIISKAEAAFIAKDFKTALRLYQRARAVKRSPLLSYMVARCYESMGRLVEAIAAYEAYLKVGTDEAVLGRAIASVRLLRQRMAKGTLVLQVTPFGSRIFIGEREVGQAPLIPQQLVPGEYPIRVTHPSLGSNASRAIVRGGETTSHVVALAPPDVSGALSQGDVNVGIIGVLASGLALGLGGAIATITAEVELQAIGDRAGASPNAPGPMTQRQAQEDIDHWGTVRTVGGVMAGVGVAAAVAGTLWWVLQEGDPKRQGTIIDSAAMTPLDGGAGLSLQGRF